MADRRWERALVTGASSGIGAAFARELAGAGTHLVLVARSGGALDDLAGELRRDHGVVAEVLAADLTDPVARRTVEDRVREAGEPVDLVVNNAGLGAFGPFLEGDRDHDDALVHLNVTALVRLTHAAAATMRARGHGGILNVSSTASFQPMPYMAAYGASKAFVTSFTEAVHEELRGAGVHVTALCPGPTRTGFPGAAGAAEASQKLPDLVWQEARDVVRAGLDGVAANRAVVVTGVGNRAVGAVSRVLPSALTRKVVAFNSRRLT